MKADIHPNYVGDRGAVLVRQHLHHPLDQGRHARRAVQRVPSLLHRQAEAGRLRRPHRPVRASLRPAQEVVVAAVGTSFDPERCNVLFDVRLGALVARHFGVEHSDQASFPGGAARTVGPTAWIFVDADAEPGGRHRAWRGRRQHGIDELHLIVERERRTCWLGEPRCSSIRRRCGAVRHRPRAGARREPVASLDRAADADADVDVADTSRRRGPRRRRRVRPRRRGVARARGGARRRRCRCEVGVGEADRELTAIVHGELSPQDALQRVVAIVRATRRPGAPRHPLNQLVPERWLRWTVCQDPEVASVSIGSNRSHSPRASARHARARHRRGDADGHGGRVLGRASTSTSCPSAADARHAIEPDAAARARRTRTRRSSGDARPGRTAAITGRGPYGDRRLAFVAFDPCWSASPVWRPSSSTSRRASPIRTSSAIRRATPSWRDATRSSTRSCRGARELRSRTDDLEAAKQMLSDSTGDRSRVCARKSTRRPRTSNDSTAS